MTTMVRQAGMRLAALIATATLFVSVGVSRADPDLTGIWTAPDGGTLSIRQIGDEVWMISRSADMGKSWTNVFHGKLEGKKLSGHFADVPDGDNRLQDTLVYKVVVKDEGKELELKGTLTYSPSNETREVNVTYKRKP